MRTSLVRKLVFICIVATGCFIASIGLCRPRCARAIDPVVSASWLSEALGMSNLVVLDVRSEAQYLEGHIPGAINAPFAVPISLWSSMPDDLLLEVPDEATLFASLGGLGLLADTQVVVVSAPNLGEPPHYGLAASTRVAETLIYAGVKNVAVLDGGYPGWIADETRPVTTDVPDLVPTIFDGQTNGSIFVSSAYVESKRYRTSILDSRDADVYFGVTVEPYAPKAGHIDGASSLPAPWIWETSDDVVYLYKDAEILGQMAAGVIGRGGKWREVIVYCGVGGYASSWWYVLTQVLGYRNVKFYDGSAQEWVIDHEMVPYVWQ